MKVGMNVQRWIFWPSFLLLAVGCVYASYRVRCSAEKKMAVDFLAAHQEALRFEQQIVHFTERALPKGLPFAAFLQALGMDAPTAARVVASSQPVFDLRHLRAGNRLAIGRSPFGDLREVRYTIDPQHILSIAPQGDSFRSEIEAVPSHSETVGVTGQVDDSLFQAVIDAGESPALALRLAAIFAFDLDFYTDTRPGDTFRVVVEKQTLASGETISYGRILAAEYNHGSRSYRAVLFRDTSGNEAYYTAEGKAMKKAFLHSPLKFAAPITSHFSYHRFHPILKQYRPHLGIDYGAPVGTPVQTIGDGKVVFTGQKGGDGNLIKVQHPNGYTTYYMHLSRIFVRDGQRVEQGQRIGLVGMTGLATGPHLDFRIELRGQFLNFEKLPLPTAEPISKHNEAAFAAARDHAFALMPALAGTRTALAQNGQAAVRSAAR
ncbi:MAG TPA: M23 family metallopeptidase [Candidatus Acidoferrales bacterium]|nr:M23 family metallopeptidase [Candidatus Acidoferrales bacterium]